MQNAYLAYKYTFYWAIKQPIYLNLVLQKSPSGANTFGQSTIFLMYGVRVATPFSIRKIQVCFFADFELADLFYLSPILY
ncbi:hypothetical protein D9M68_469500 [compost metagenome]